MSNKKSDCIFCKIATKKIETSLEYEDESIIAFDDKNPQAPVHVLIIPREHIEKINDITANTTKLLGKMMVAAKEIAKEKKIFDSGYRLIINCGKDGGQLIEHLHLHLIGGRRLGWPPG
jgi:histidine triad (HIT) family protein